MSRALWAFCTFAFTFLSIVTPYQAYAVLPAVAGVAVRSAAGSILLPLARELMKPNRWTAKEIGTAIGWTAFSSLGIEAAKRAWNMSTAKGPADAPFAIETVAPVVSYAPSSGTGFTWRPPASSSKINFGSVYATPDEFCQSAFKPSLEALYGPKSVGVLDSGEGWVTCSALPIGTNVGVWGTPQGGGSLLCPDGFSPSGLSGAQACVRTACPAGFLPVGDQCQRGDQYAKDGVATIQAYEGGWRPDPRDPDPLPPELVEWLEKGFITKDNFGNTVSMPKPISTADGGLRLEASVSGSTSGGSPTVVNNWIQLDQYGNLVSAGSNEYFGTIGNVSEQRPLELPDDYAREKTLADAKDILAKWVEADKAMQEASKSQADAVKDKIKLGEDHWKIGGLGLPETGIFEAPGVSGLTDRVPGARSCVTYSMSLAGNPFVVDPCPWLPYYKPTLDWFVIASGVITSVFLVLRVRED